MAWEKREEVDEAAMHYVMEYERSRHMEPEDVSKLNLGWDITSYNPKDGDEIYIEVKGHSGRAESIMSENEWRKAKEYGENYHLYVVFHALDKNKRRLEKKKDPAHKTDVKRRVSYIISANDVEGI